MLKGTSTYRTQRAYGYGRVSGLGQLNGHGPQRQRDLISIFAKKNGYEIVQLFEDAHTGVEADRPEFLSMLAAAREQNIKVVIVESLDRFSRDHIVQSILLAKLAEDGIHLIEAVSGRDVTSEMADDPTKEAIILMQAVFSQWDKKQLVRKLRLAREAKKAATGRCGGRLPFGHEKYPNEASTLLRIQKLRRKPRMGERLSYQGIADALNSESIPTRTGSKWSPSTVQQICKRRGWT